MVPLPAADQDWPPKAYDEPAAKIAEWSAWYSGKPEDLRRVYGGHHTSNYPENRSSQYRGGIVGAVSRWFWGPPSDLGEPDERVHVPLADDISGVAAGLLFGDPPDLTSAVEADVDRAAQQDRLDLLAQDMHATLLEAAEVGSGLGGVYLRAYWDRDVRPEPWLTSVHADAAVPEWRGGELSAVTFWWVIDRTDQVVVRHLERHASGVIEHGVYEGTADKLGRPVPLTRHQDTAGLLPAVNTGLDLLTAAYVPNMRPNRLWRSLPGACNLGRSDYSACEPMLDLLDRTWSSLARDMELGVGQIIIPKSTLETLGPGKGAIAHQRRYTPVDVLDRGDSTSWAQAIQHAIRVEEHLTLAMAITQRVISDAGYSGSSFGLPGETSQTATESSNKREKSVVTTARKGLHWRRALAHMTQVLLELGNRLDGWGVATDRPGVQLAESPESPQQAATTVELWTRAQAASTESKVRHLHPDWADDRVQREVDAILAEQALSVPVADPFGGTGDGGEGDEPDPEEQP